jgi:hypothetical protein
VCPSFFRGFPHFLPTPLEASCPYLAAVAILAKPLSCALSIVILNFPIHATNLHFFRGISEGQPAMRVDLSHECRQYDVRLGGAVGPGRGSLTMIPFAPSEEFPEWRGFICRHLNRRG